MFSVTKKLTSIFTDIADAIRSFTEINTPIKADDFVSILQNYTEDKIKKYGLSQSLFNSYFNNQLNSCLFIPPYQYWNNRQLSSIECINCKIINHSAFYSCFSLAFANFPACEVIGQTAFADCSSLTSISFPNCTFIGYQAFCCCPSLTSINFPNCETINTCAFERCTFLTSISFPKCITISFAAFRSCFYLRSINFPVCKVIGEYAFFNCGSLTTAIFPTCEIIFNEAFNKCYNLISLYLLNSSLCKLNNLNAFSSTPIGGYSITAKRYGSIFVPASLVNSYKLDSMWSNFSSYIFAVEEE